MRGIEGGKKKGEKQRVGERKEEEEKKGGRERKENPTILYKLF